MSEQVELTEVVPNTEPDSPFEPSQRVIDTKGDEAPEENIARVIDPCAGIASEYDANGQYVSEYDSNQDFPDDDTVVVVVFESKLDDRVRDWKDMLGDDFKENIEKYSDGWDIPMDKYFYPYPSERLEPYTED